MSIVIIVDTETTGPDTGTCRLIEAAGVAYSIDHAAIVDAWSGVAATEDPDDWGEEEVHGIPWEVARLSGRDEAALVGDFFGWVYDINASPLLLAHSAAFDRSVLASAAHRAEVSPLAPEDRWICTYEDFAWPRGTGSLLKVATNHGVSVPAAHRALADCMLLARTLTRIAEQGYSLRRLTADATMPRVSVRAEIGDDDSYRARKRGFRWDPRRCIWHRRIRADLIEELAAQWGFPLSTLARDAAA